MEDLIKEVKEKIIEYSKEQVEFTIYCETKMKDRNIEGEEIISALFNLENLCYAEIQNRPLRDEIEKRHKLAFKISNKYYLVIIVVFDESVLKVINVIKTSKNMEKKWKKKISK